MVHQYIILYGMQVKHIFLLDQYSLKLAQLVVMKVCVDFQNSSTTASWSAETVGLATSDWAYTSSDATCGKYFWYCLWAICI